MPTIPLTALDVPDVDSTHPRVDLIDMRGSSALHFPGRLLSQDARRAEVALLAPAPELSVGARLVLRWITGRLTAILVGRDANIITLEVRKVHRTDQRTYPRVSGGIRCLCRFGSHWSWPRQVIDISVGGISIVTTAHVELADPVVVMLGLEADPGPWRLRGRAVRVQPQGEHTRVGVEFDGLTEAAQAALIRHCTDWLDAEDKLSPAP